MGAGPMIDPSPEHQAIIAAASPSRGRSIAGSVAPLIDDVHAAVGAITRFAKRTKFVPLWLDTSDRDTIPFADPWERVGWAITALAIVEAVAAKLPPDIDRALAWFEGERSTDARKSWGGADAFLQRVCSNADIGPLLPYLLDTYGRTSRLDVIRDETLRGQRNARKAIGSFYTPADVAYFMAAAIARDAGAKGSRERPTMWFDPAAGSGVFLAACLRREKDLGLANVVDFAIHNLFGTDISPQACDFAAFTVLSEIAGDATATPRTLWRSIRHNIIALDSLSLLDRRLGGRDGLKRVFPNMDGPIRLICNPPYTSASSDPPRVSGAPVRSLYLPFVEMAWRIADGPSDASSLVVPLALGANTTAEHRRTRAAMSNAGGRWTLLFFDRQPHALFGEEAKTRATIAIRRPGPLPADIWTSGLLKWTSRQRRQIFSEGRAVDLGRAKIARLVPKLASNEEVRLYARLSEYRLRRPDRPTIERAAPDEIVGTALSNDVFVGGTAYNFLNIFRNYPDHLSWRGELSSSGIHKLRFASGIDADVATALLSSRTAFWLWHAECDGFHVPSWFLEDLPLLDLTFNKAERLELAGLGKQIWARLQNDIVVSNNRNRLTFAFRPSQLGRARDRSDEIILASLGATEAELRMLGEFEFRVVSIDGTNRAARSSPSAAITKKGSS
jgi:hypothetical protein